MDPHFPEYLAAIAGMNDLYGERPDDQPTEFHADHADRNVPAAEPTATVVAA